MGHTYKVYDQKGVYYITCTVHQWVDVFTRKEYMTIVTDSIKYCQEHKGLELYAWVIMSNHCHFIVSSKQNNLSDIIRDFKKFTSKTLIQAIENNPKESRKRWLLWLLKKEDTTWFWEEGYHGEEIFSRAFFESKIDYIHNNPLRAGIVEKEEDYTWSSCVDHYGIRKGILTLTEYR